MVPSFPLTFPSQPPAVPGSLRPFSGAIKSTSAITGDPATAGALGGEVSEDTPLLMVYTSGTTGTPKGAVLSQQAIEFNALNAVHMHDMCSRDTILTVLPTFHVGGLNIQTTPALYSGAEVILEAQFDPGRWLQLVATRKPTLSVLVPATMHAVMQHPDWSTTSLDSLRSISTGSTDVPPDLIEAFHTRNIPVIQIYGATETGPVAIYQRVNEAKTHVGSIGYPGLHTNVKLVDRDGSEILDQQPGEIWVQGKHVATGYWDVSVGKADAFDQGWFPSGDVARRDEDGRYWFVDRIKRIIISGGENIYPIELERILDASDLIEEASVVGKSHERWGAVPIVVAVARNPGVAEADVLALFDQHVARFKRPHGVLFVDALPRNALGKIEYGELSDWVAGA